MPLLTLQITSLRDFVAEEVAGQETAAIDLERFKRQLELYLNDLRAAVEADLLTICENCCPTGVSP